MAEQWMLVLACGFGDAQTHDRLDAAINWYFDPLVQGRKVICLTCGVVDDATGISLAEEMKNYLLSKGVSLSNIHVVTRKGGSNTWGEVWKFLETVPLGAERWVCSTWYHVPRICYCMVISGWKRPRVRIAWKVFTWRDPIREIFALGAAVTFLRGARFVDDK